jgi:GNAT superfamily N-acetyltransferase
MAEWDLSERVRTAHADMWQVQGRLREHTGGGAAELRGIRLMASGIAHPQWNNGDVTGPDADLEGAREFFAQRGVPWGVRVPAGMPWPHGRRLFRKRLMGLPATGFRPAPEVPGLRIELAGPAQLDAVVAVDSAAFGEDSALVRLWFEPHLTAPCAAVVLATIDGVRVATAHTVLSDGRAGSCLYLGGVAVLEQARRRGVGAAVSGWLLARGFAAGAQLAHLNPDTDAAARIYERLGFAESAGLDIYVDL